MPRVSVCVSCLDQPELLKDTLKSILNQSFKDWECIVVDDGSAVPIKPVVESFNDPRFIFHRFEQNRGIPHGANWAYKKAQGDYIQALGCDEVIYEHKFRDQVAFLDDNPEISCVWGVPGNGEMGPVYEWEQVLRRAHNRSREHWLKTLLLLEGVPIGGASALWRRSLFDSIGYFDDKLTAFSDHEWFVRLFEKHKGLVLPFRWMNEVPGHKAICTRTADNAGKLDAEYKYVRDKHPLQLPPTDGLITIAIPVFNHARFIGDSLKSLFSQTDQNFEVLITDDGSTDNLEEALKPFQDSRISFFKSEKNEGHMATVNKMLKLAKGDFFVSFSADDTMSPDFLEKCRNAFKKDPFLEYVASQNDFMTEDGKPFEGDHPLKLILKATNRPQDEWWQLFRQGNVYFGIGMYRTSALREVGGWEPQHGVISDYQMYLKLLPRYNFHIIEEPLTHTRIHGKNQSLLSPQESKKLARRYYEAQKPFYQPRPRVVIATPFYELKGFSPYIASLLEVVRYLERSGIDWRFMELSGDSYVHRARNSMCMAFLQDPYATDLFFIDSDMAWNPEAFVDILRRPEPIIGGTYPVKNKWELWTSKPTIVDPETDPHYVGHILPDGSALIKAYQLAGGFLRIKRSVLEKFMEFYPTHKYADSHPNPDLRIEQVEFFSCGVNREPEINLIKEIEGLMEKSNGAGVDLAPLKPKFEALKVARDFVGEDYCFSNRLNAMGIELFIYPNATISHFGIQGWTGNFNNFLREKEKELQKQKAS
mgnify:CR=1 FL=1